MGLRRGGAPTEGRKVGEIRHTHEAHSTLSAPLRRRRSIRTTDTSHCNCPLPSLSFSLHALLQEGNTPAPFPSVSAHASARKRGERGQGVAPSHVPMALAHALAMRSLPPGSSLAVTILPPRAGDMRPLASGLLLPLLPAHPPPRAGNAHPLARAPSPLPPPRRVPTRATQVTQRVMPVSDSERRQHFLL